MRTEACSEPAQHRGQMMGNLVGIGEFWGGAFGFFGGLGVFFAGIGFLWWVSLQARRK